MKILPTIGPITQDTSKLKTIFKYSKIVRLNASHNEISWHKNIITKIKKLNKDIDILLDIPGIKPRTDNKKTIFVKKNQIIKFIYKNTTKSNCISTTKPLPKSNKKNKFFSVDDGKLIFKIIKSSKNLLIGKALDNYQIHPKKGINIPLSVYNNDEQKKNYLKYLNYFKKSNFNLVGLSFVQNYKLIVFLKKKYPHLLFVSKIENSEGLKNAENICKYSDIVMIDRGDLSAEIGGDKLFDSILKISFFAKKFGKPLIMATENLENLGKNISPSKNDIISLGFSSQVNSDIIMLSEETAVEKSWKKTIDWLDKFIKKQKKIKIKNTDKNIFWKTVDLVRNNVLVVFTKKGFMFDKIFKHNIKNDVIIFTDTQKTKSIAKFYKNARCIMTNKFNNNNISKFYYENIKKNKKIIFKNNKNAFLITISFPKKGSVANTLSFINRDDF